MTYKDWDSLEEAIKWHATLAVMDATKKCGEAVQEMLQRFYDYGEPIEYERTYNLLHSMNTSFYENVNGGGTGQIELDTTTPYTTGKYTTQVAFDAAEEAYPKARIVGYPHFWEDAMKKWNDEIIPECFRAHGFTK